LLASEGRGGQVLCRRARPNRVGNVLVEPRHLADDRRGQIVRHRDRFDGLAELRGARADPVSVVGVQLRQSIERFIDRKRARHDPPERIRRDAEAARHPDPLDPRQLPRLAPLPPTSATCVWSISSNPKTSLPLSTFARSRNSLLPSSKFLDSIRDFAARPCSCGKPLVRPILRMAGFRYSIYSFHPLCRTNLRDAAQQRRSSFGCSVVLSRQARTVQLRRSHRVRLREQVAIAVEREGDARMTSASSNLHRINPGGGTGATPV